MAVHDHGREGLVVSEHPLERVSDSCHRLGVESRLAVARRKASREQELVALAQRNVEGACERQHHLAAGVGPSALDETDVASCDAGLDREGELAHPALATPVLKQLPDRAGH